MTRINTLDLDTSNKIAAGEVVERPLSVVKELLENSIDAGATNINIEIEDGGQRLIRIIDNGSGIHYDDLEKAFRPHCTSKIKQIEDVYRINTLGFRGEALASIASVSKVKLDTFMEGSLPGHIEIDGGQLKACGEGTCNKGTRIEVKDLFFNLPARLKFLKSPQREGAMITDLVNRIAISHPEVSIKLYNNGRQTTTTFGSDNLKDVIRCVYGKTTYENLIYFENVSDATSVYGYVGNQELSRGNRNNQTIFVNKRYVKSKTLGIAVENAVKSFYMINKFPFFVLFIDTYPELIDVNVHPTKTEIKFKNDKEVFDLIFKGVHNAIKESVRGNFDLDEEKDENVESAHAKQTELSIPLGLDPKLVNMQIDNAISNDGTSPQDELKSFEIKASSYDKPFKENSSLTNNKELICDDSNLPYRVEASNGNILTSSEERVDENLPKFPKYRVLGQILKTYIVMESEDGMILLDQHAAHEKILFEKYRDEIINANVVSQILLAPVLVDLTISEHTLFSENRNVFESSGFTIEDFGDNTVIIKEVPLVIGSPNVKELFLDILENIKSLGKGSTAEVKFYKIATAACKSAIKAHDELTIMEMEALVEQLRYIDQPFNCPHGRPTMIRVNNNELEKRFKRIQ